MAELVRELCRLKPAVQDGGVGSRTLPAEAGGAR
jgi:hypothetical protein